MGKSYKDISIFILKLLLSAIAAITKTKKEKNFVARKESSKTLTLKYHAKYIKFLKISNMFCIPIGLLAFITIFLSIIYNDEKDIGYIIFTAISCLVLFMMGQTIKNKKIIIENDTIQIIRWLRKPLTIQKKRIKVIKATENKAKAIGENEKKLFTITQLYDNYDTFLKSMKNIVKKRD